jgi:hypothetical protein
MSYLILKKTKAKKKRDGEEPAAVEAVVLRAQ